MKFRLDELKKDSLYYFIARMFPAFSGLLSITLFIRLLGREIYGEYALIQAAILFTGNVAPIWLSQSILRYYSRFDSTQQRRIFSTAILFSTLLTTLLFAIGFLIFAITYLHLAPLNLFIATIAVLALIFYNLLVSVQQAMLKPKKIILAEFCRGFFIITLPLGLLFILGIKSYTVLLLGSALTLSIACYVISRGIKIDFAWHSNFTRIIKKVIMPFGIPLTLWIGLSTLLNTSDRYIINYFMDAKAVGTYSAVYDVVYNSFGLMLAPVLYAAHPRIVRLWNQRQEKDSLNLLKKAITLEIIIGIMALLTLSQVAPILTRIILGTNDHSATQLVLPVAAGAICWQMAMLVHKTLELKGKTIRMLIYVCCALVANVIGNIVFIPLYGYVASAYITTLSAFIYMMLVITDTLIARWLTIKQHPFAFKLTAHRKAIL
ncbi:MAG TPA: oligosaccharide flippase family protein [Gammaproteobacteria bacterium]|nr:oligosaccharide flippase family protein [Gammaproteobacteria bacterium]